MRLLPLRKHPSHSDAFVQIYTEYLKEQGQKSSSLDHDARKALQMSLSDDKTHEVFVFEYNDTIVGFSKIDIHEECFPDEDLPEVCMQVVIFYVLAEYRGHHHGENAFKLLRQYGRDKKAALIEIDADNETAKKFITKQGLELVGKGTHATYRGFV